MFFHHQIRGRVWIFWGFIGFHLRDANYSLDFRGNPKAKPSFSAVGGVWSHPTRGHIFGASVCLQTSKSEHVCMRCSISCFLIPPKKWPNISGVAELLDKLRMDFSPTNQGIDVFGNIPWGWLSLGNYHEQQMGILFLLNMSSLVCNWIGVWAVCQDHVLDKSSLLPHWDVPELSKRLVNGS